MKQGIWLIMILCAMLFVLPVQARNDEGTGPNYTGPEQVLQEGIERLQRMLSIGDGVGRDKLEMFVNTKISPLFDFKEMAKFTGGSYYQSFSVEQKQTFRDQLETMFLTAVIQQVAIYNGAMQPRIDVYPMRYRSETEAEARARVFFPGGKIKRLSFLLHQGDRGWQVVDVSANGQSALLYYRTFFKRRASEFGSEALLNL